MKGIKGIMQALGLLAMFQSIFGGRGSGNQYGLPQNTNPMAGKGFIKGDAKFGNFETIDDYRENLWGKDYVDNQQRKRMARGLRGYRK